MLHGSFSNSVAWNSGDAAKVLPNNGSGEVRGEGILSPLLTGRKPPFYAIDIGGEPYSPLMAAFLGKGPSMASVSVGTKGSAAIGEKLLACVAGQGSAAHPYPSSMALLKGPQAARNLSDAVHYLCALHGRYPGVVDHASGRCAHSDARTWLVSAAEAFGRERAFLARLAVAAGPVPGTPGSAESEAVVIGQRHAVEMLAQSERNGCAVGAALAVLADWAAVRTVLDAAAARFGVDAPSFKLGDRDALRNIAGLVSASPSAERALLFGAEQIAIQHFGLWGLLEARQQARGDL